MMTTTATVNEMAIEDLRLTCPIVHRAFHMYYHGKCDYTQALEMMVLAMHAANEAQFKSLLEAQLRSPYPQMIMKGPST